MKRNTSSPFCGIMWLSWWLGDTGMGVKRYALAIVSLGMTALTVAAAVLLIRWENTYARAESFLQNGKFTQARDEFISIAFYRDAKERLLHVDIAQTESINAQTESIYADAVRYMDRGLAAEARALLGTIPFHRDAAGLLVQCDIIEARQLVADRRFDEARAILEPLREHPGAYAMLRQIEYGEALAADELYLRGVAEYRSGSLESAAYYFSYTAGRYDTQAYLSLIAAKTDTLPDGRELLALIGFEDANDVILGSDAFLSGFLGQCRDSDWGAGRRWSDEAGHFIEYYLREGRVWSRSNLPRMAGQNYRIHNGSQWHGDNEVWNRSWDFTIISRNQIELHNHQDGTVYILSRRD
jgi:hypothetical protein